MKMILVLAMLVSTAARAELRLNCFGLTPNLAKPAPAQDPCLDQGTSLVALTSSGVLYICENSKERAHYDVSLGRGGVGKTKEGDLKTPLGTYSLGTPRPSMRFGLFVPVNYPTPEQQAQGFSGSDVGIHGPERLFACRGRLNVLVNWTQGCLAVADDHFIAEISDFVKAHPQAPLHILE